MYNQKPLSGDLIDYGHPLSRGLVGLWLFNEGNNSNKVFDLSGNGNDGTLTGTAVFSTGKFGAAVSIPSNSDYTDHISCGTKSVLELQNFTSVSWVRLNSIASQPAGAGYIVASKSDNISSTGWEFGVQEVSGDLMFAYNDGDVRGWYVSENSNIAIYIWYQLVLTRNQGTGNLKFYVNGILTDTVAATTGTIQYSNDLMVLGDQSQNVGLGGLLDHSLLYNYVLHTSEVALLYREPFCMVRTKRRRIIYDEIAGAPPGSFPYYYREIASRRIA